MEDELTEALKKSKMTIRRQLKRKVLMTRSLKNPRLATRCRFIFKKNERHKHIKNKYH